MGVIVENGKRDFILIVSENLFDKITSDEKEEIILFTLKDVVCDLSIFICKSEYQKFYELRNITSTSELEKEINRVAGNKYSSETVFNDYLRRHNITYDKKAVPIFLTD